MKGNRKGISQRVRFEVFKRDSFKCQYCGASAPGVVLEVDHIKPVAEGGENDVLNYVTSCSGCNGGKGPIELSDESRVQVERRQLEELQERRAQLEMMLEWREGLRLIEDDAAAAIASEFHGHESGRIVGPAGRAMIRKWLKKFSVSELLTATEQSCVTYLRTSNGGSIDPESADKAFAMIPRVAAMIRKQESNPHLSDGLYIRAILRNRFGLLWHEQKKALAWVLASLSWGIDKESIRDLACNAETYGDFLKSSRAWLESVSDGRAFGQENPGQAQNG